MKRLMWVVTLTGGVLLSGGVVIAQTGQQSGQSGSTSSSQSGSSSSASQVSAQDKAFMKKAAQGGMEEVEIGQMMSEKGKSQDVKDFAKRMVDDHSKANDELKSLAQQKGVTLPTEMGSEGQALKARLEKLSGDQLDKAYMQSMVKDHVKDVGEFKQASTSAHDSDLKTWAGKTLPTLQDHLKQAKQIAAKEGGAKAATTAQQ